jgi:K+-transporting ATPase KdpF subunit
MPTLYVVGALISAGLFVYLLYAMLQPEKFS